MRKLFALVLLTLMLFSVLADFSVFATAQPTITVESVTVEEGKNASVKVMIENNPGMWGMDLRVNYDKTKLTLKNVTNGQVFTAEEWTEGNINGEQYILSYARNDFNDTKANGTLAILTFEIKDFTQSHNVEVYYRAGDVINVNFGEIDFKIVNGKIAVKSNALEKTDAAETPEADLPSITQAPVLETYENSLPQTTEAPVSTDEPEGTNEPTPTPLSDQAVDVNNSNDNVYIIVLVGALIIFTALYILIKEKNAKS